MSIPAREDASPAPLRLGLIGAGRWGRVYIRTIEGMSGLELVLLCSSNPESKSLVSPSCRITSDWREVATSGEIDGVIVATPPALHARMVEEAVRSGLPVMVEKPLTSDFGEARLLEEIVGEAGALVLVDHIHLFHPAYRALKREAADMGEVRHILSEGGNRGPFREDASALWDYGPHDLALCLDFLGASPTRITAERAASQLTEEGYGEVVSLALEFAGGVRAEISAGNLMVEKRRRFAVWFEKGALVFDDLAEHPLVRYETEGGFSGRGDFSSPGALSGAGGPGGAGHPIPASPTLPLTAALEAFASGIRGKGGEGFGLALGVEIVRLLGECEAQLPPRAGVS